jgi:hypothetical protein
MFVLIVFYLCSLHRLMRGGLCYVFLQGSMEKAKDDGRDEDEEEEEGKMGVVAITLRARHLRE